MLWYQSPVDLLPGDVVVGRASTSGVHGVVVNVTTSMSGEYTYVDVLLYREPGVVATMSLLPANSSDVFPDLVPRTSASTGNRGRDCRELTGAARAVCVVAGHVSDRNAHVVRLLHRRPDAAERWRHGRKLDVELSIGVGNVRFPREVAV